MDSSGVARSLECDDHEALLVGAWVRTGLWLQPELSTRLDIQLEQQEQEVSSNRRPASSDTDGTGADSSSSTSSSTNCSTPSRHKLGKTPQQALRSTPGTTDKPLVLTVRLVDGKLVNRVRVCPCTWAVQGLNQPLCGDTEIWQFGSWKAWQPNIKYPEHVSHQAIAGGHHVYLAQKCITCTPSPLSHFQCPATPVLPLDTSFTPGIPPELPVWRAGSGHLLVRPQINGKEGGYMVVDTGASGFVITPSAALSLGLDAFGELFAASISGKIPAQFVKARSWSLGPLHISSPVMMTMALDGLVRGGPPGGDVIGIVGYDIFRRAVIELPSMSSTSHATVAPNRSPSPPHSVDYSSTDNSMAGSSSSTEMLKCFSTSSSSSNSSKSAVVVVDDVSVDDTGLQEHCQATSSVLLGGVPATCGPFSAQVGSTGTSAVQPMLVGRNAGGVVAAAAASGPLPFLQGLLSAASAGLGGGGWGGSRKRVHSSLTGEACVSAGTNPGSGSSLPVVTPEPAAGQAVTANGNSNGLQRRPGNSKLLPTGGCQQYTMRLYNPDEYGPSQDQGWMWQEFRMIASLPHLEVHFRGADGTPLTVLLMVDSGACGADIMLHARAMRELDLQKLSRPTSHFVRGVGGSSCENSVKVEMLDLDWVELGGLRFQEVKCMYAGVGGLDISLYSAGILCGDLLTRLPACYDYARKRMGFKLPLTLPPSIP